MCMSNAERFFVMAKRGPNKGKWFLDTGFDEVEVHIKKADGNVYKFNSAGRKYIYPQEGEEWSVIHLYFKKRTTMYSFRFMNGKFTNLGFEDLRPQTVIPRYREDD